MVHVRVLVPEDRPRQRERWIEGARWAIYHHVRLLGTAPATTMTVVDAGTGSPRAGVDAGTIPVAAPFVSSQRGMAVETAIARGVAHAFWRSAVRCDDENGTLVEGLARYTATVATVAEYGPLQLPATVGFYEQRWLGGLLPWVIRFEVPAWPSFADDSGDDAARAAAAIESLARWIGAPTVEAALRTIASRRRDRCVSWRDLQQAVSDLSGLDLGWFFEPAFAVPRTFDYGVEMLSSAAMPAAGGYRTRVVVRRYGDGLFTGSAERPVGPFEAGRGVELLVRFADGSERRDAWDGRAERRVFEYDGASAAASAVVDPRAVILLDVNRTNNSLTLTPRAREASAAWSGTWMVWLQDLLLSYSSLV